MSQSDPPRVAGRLETRCDGCAAVALQVAQLRETVSYLVGMLTPELGLERATGIANMLQRQYDQAKGAGL